MEVRVASVQSNTAFFQTTGASMWQHQGAGGMWLAPTWCVPSCAGSHVFLGQRWPVGAPQTKQCPGQPRYDARCQSPWGDSPWQPPFEHYRDSCACLDDEPVELSSTICSSGDSEACTAQSPWADSPWQLPSDPLDDEGPAAMGRMTIDEQTSIPEDLFKRLMGAGQNARCRGQHRRTRDGRLVLADICPSV